ncbi:MAG: hypothetical protein KGK11_09330 [Sphingomonadales bacterium]|nr:hypothetical protein [Sphingomonadales bacterium]
MLHPAAAQVKLPRDLAFGARLSHLAAMAFWRNIHPGDAIADFVAVWRSAGRLRWRFLAAAIAVTAALFSLIVRDEHRIEPRPPHIDYITSWHAGRSEAEIRASNARNQQRKEALAAEQARADEELRNIYKAIGRASGMDVDAIEREAKADQAASAAAAAHGAAAIPAPPHP